MEAVVLAYPQHPLEWQSPWRNLNKQFTHLSIESKNDLQNMLQASYLRRSNERSISNHHESSLHEAFETPNLHSSFHSHIMSINGPKIGLTCLSSCNDVQMRNNPMIVKQAHSYFSSTSSIFSSWERTETKDTEGSSMIVQVAWTVFNSGTII